MKSTYFLRRLLIMIPLFFLMTFTVFGLLAIAPGNPVEQELAQIKGADASGSGGKLNSSPEKLEKIRKDLEKKYGLDRPFLERYNKWLEKLFFLDFGESHVTRQGAFQRVIDRIPVSLSFGIPAFLLSYLISIPLGILKARKDGTTFDISSSFILFIGTAIPSLVSAIVFLLIFCTDRILPIRLFPLGGLPDMKGNFFNNSIQWVYYLAIPVLVSLLPQFTSMTLLMKNSFLEIMRSDFVRTARAKGLSGKKVLFKHALRNAILPLCVGIGSLLGVFLTGSIVIESVFGLPGMGLLSLDSAVQRDYNVLMCVLVLSSTVLMAGQLLSDFIMVLIDPRIELK